MKFVKVSLKSLGLTVQLNHSGSYCSNPIPCHASLLVLHTNGIHEIGILYCGCSRALPQHIQLLRRRLYPASQITVKCCATFELLSHLHKMALTTKSSTYDFYRALEKRTNNTGMHLPKSRYQALSRMVMQWRHLKMLKWAGRGHDPAGVAGTKWGELAVLCPSCPIEDVNLLDGWRDAPAELKFLYMAFICMDANFRLKNQLVSNYSQDPGLGTGLAYMVPRQPYENYVLSRADEEDISTCVGFQALAKANTKFSRGLRYTGVNLTVCGRSEMIMPLGVGNLHKGKRYANMDYVFASALQNIMVPLIIISYDVACQWFIHLFDQMEEHWPEDLKIPKTKKLIPAIPKLHEPMHQTANHHMYSLNYIPGVGLSDCECPERVWAPHNALGNSTKTLGPGSRQDVLDDHFGFWNWQKYVGLGITLLRKYKNAVADRNIQVEAHRGLTKTWETVAPKWEKMCKDWDEDEFPKKKENPYLTLGASMSESEVKKRLEADEKARLSAGGAVLHATSPSSFVALGLELEDAQRRLQRLVKKKPQDSSRKTDNIVEQRRTLRTRIEAWEKIMPVYMPGILQYQADIAKRATRVSNATTPPTDNAEDAQLWLPSRLPSEERKHICKAELPRIEEELRDAQLKDSLDGVRRILRLKARMVQFKNRNIRGQRNGTCSRAMIDRVHNKARVCVEKYRAARLAKLALAGAGKWEESFQVLQDGDVRGYQDPNRLRHRQGRAGVLEDDQLVEVAMDTESHLPPDSALEEDPNFLFAEERTRRDGTGETRRTISWIWRTGDVINNDEGDMDIVRSEWARSRARAAQAREEVMLLKEEMRRVLAFLEWKTKWWLSRQTLRKDLKKDIEEGIQGYAQSQAEIHACLRVHFRKLWETPLTESAIPGMDSINDDDNSDDDGDDSDLDDELLRDDDDDENED